MNSNETGQLSELKVTTRLVELGYKVLQPIGERSFRYDLAIDENGKFNRVQVKTARWENGSVVIPTVNVRGRYSRYTKGYIGDADCIIAYSSHTEKCYRIPSSLFNTSVVYLRVDTPKNNQTKNIRWAEDYEV